MESTPAPAISVVVATYNRGGLLERLLEQMGRQTLAPAAYEVVVVDDGSAEPVRSRVEALELPCALRVEEQANAGAAAARHRGILAARGELIVIVDDDMQVGPDFLAEHLKAHPAGSRRAVLGAIRRPPDFDQMPLFERWHQKLLEVFAERAGGGAFRLRGNNLYTANLSFRRADYLAVGGFDQHLERSEDAELGLRLEEAGVEIGFSAEAATVNGSDHTSLEKWRGRAERYGGFDGVISRKHPAIRHASPWHYFESLSPLTAPLMAGPALVPPVSRALGRAAFAAASAADRLGLAKLAYTGAGLTYGMDYFRGLLGEMGVTGMLVDLAKYLRTAEAATGKRFGRWDLVAKMISDVQADHRVVLEYATRFRHEGTLRGGFLKDLQRIGLQMMVAIRVMRMFRDAGMTVAAKIVSRSIRHLYGSDIHWDAEFEPGVVIGHGYAVGISGGCRIGSGCIILHGVSMGLGIDPVSRQAGEPTLERNVHVGPHAMIFGPVTIGEGSKIQAGALVTQSVPRNSVVWTPKPEIRAREQRAAPQEGAGDGATDGPAAAGSEPAPPALH